MSPRTRQQFEEIRNEKAELIKNTALLLFAQQGFEATSVSAIAKQAGISKGLMYNYFSSKEELLRQIVMGKFKDFLGFLKIENPQEIKKDEIIYFIDENLNLLIKEPDFYKLYFSISFQSAVFNLLIDDFMQILGQLIEIFTQYFQQQGYADAYEKARFVLAVFDGVGIHYVADTKGFPIDSVRKMIINLI